MTQHNEVLQILRGDRRIMNGTASCRHLTYKHPAYYGCTFGEVCLITVIYFLADFLLSGLSAIFWGHFFLFFLIGFIASLILIRPTAQIIGRLKENKQHGYLLLKFRQFLNRYFSVSIPYTRRIGIWSKRRTL